MGNESQLSLKKSKWHPNLVSHELREIFHFESVSLIAGDHVKFNLPMAFSAHVLAYGLNRWKDGYSSSNQLNNMYEMLRTPLDYFMKCWRPQSQEYYAQVSIDHQMQNTIWVILKSTIYTSNKQRLKLFFRIFCMIVWNFSNWNPGHQISINIWL